VTLQCQHGYIRRNDLDQRLTVEWVEGNGGFCDCEVLNNVELVVAGAVPGYDRIRNETGSVN
jgi:hypothetical protein